MDVSQSEPFVDGVFAEPVSNPIICLPSFSPSQQAQSQGIAEVRTDAKLVLVANRFPRVHSGPEQF